MTVFDANAQRDNGGKRLSESIFAHLNRSAEPFSEARRTLIEEWLQHVPPSEQHELSMRIRSGKDDKFASAFQELFLHEFLRRQSCKLEFHPAISDTAKRPDFLVHPGSGESFLLEARTSTKVASGPENNRRSNRMRDFLRQLDLGDYKLIINELRAGTNDLRKHSLDKHIRNAISLSPSDHHGYIDIVPFSTSDGWFIKLTAFPEMRDDRNPSPTVRIEAWSNTWIGPSYPLRALLNKKARKYGQLSIPYVIAINSFEMMDDIEETLYGVQSGVIIKGMTPKQARGFWGREGTPTHQRVSAVLFTRNLWAATVLRGEVYCSLWLNPWAERPYDGLLTNLPTYRFENCTAREYPGRPWHELMGFRPLKDSSLLD